MRGGSKVIGRGNGDEGIDGGREGGGSGNLLSRTTGTLTTQTPGMAYLPSAAFRNMMLALFWDRSCLGFLVAGSAMFTGGRVGREA